MIYCVQQYHAIISLIIASRGQQFAILNYIIPHGVVKIDALNKNWPIIFYILNCFFGGRVTD